MKQINSIQKFVRSFRFSYILIYGFVSFKFSFVPWEDCNTRSFVDNSIFILFHSRIVNFLFLLAKSYVLCHIVYTFACCVRASSYIRIYIKAGKLLKLSCQYNKVLKAVCCNVSLNLTAEYAHLFHRSIVS